MLFGRRRRDNESFGAVLSSLLDERFGTVKSKTIFLFERFTLLDSRRRGFFIEVAAPTRLQESIDFATLL